MKVNLLYSEQRHVSATHVTVFEVLSASLSCVGTTSQVKSYSFG
jgi:hypothetical protein